MCACVCVCACACVCVCVECIYSGSSKFGWMWSDCLQGLSEVARLLMLLFLDLCSLNGPICNEWFLIVLLLVPLRDAIHNLFYPAVLGGPVSELEICLFDLPA